MEGTSRLKATRRHVMLRVPARADNRNSIGADRLCPSAGNRLYEGLIVRLIVDDRSGVVSDRCTYVTAALPAGGNLPSCAAPRFRERRASHIRAVEH
jgi:hypothetical protein